MDSNFVFFSSVIVVLLSIGWLLDYFLFRPHKASSVLNALFEHFSKRNERPIEFRILESKAKQNSREFEVKTIHQKYYNVVVKGMKVLSTESIESFTISEEDSYMHGVIDPVLLDSFKISVKDSNQ